MIRKVTQRSGNEYTDLKQKQTQKLRHLNPLLFMDGIKFIVGIHIFL